MTNSTGSSTSVPEMATKKAVKISRILHAGYVFESEGTEILFDPLFENPFSRNCYAFPAVTFDLSVLRALRFAAVFISHYHDDHCSFESLDLIERQTPIYVYCVFEEMFSLLRRLGFTNVHSLQIDDSVPIGPFRVTPRRALDSDVDSMFQIQAAGLNVLNVVDALIDSSTLGQLVQDSPWDLVLWPFQTMRESDVIAPSRSRTSDGRVPTEWTEQLRRLKPRYVVPSSCQFLQEPWSWYNHAMFPITYRGFRQQMEEALPASRVLRMNPSTSFVLDRQAIKKVMPLEWVRPVGDQEVDYDYRPKMRPPLTSEIAKHFPALTGHEAEVVSQYCRVGLTEKYRSLDEPTDDYFGHPRLWRLSIYDSLGTRTDFHYLIERSRIRVANSDEGPLAWTTEIPAVKIYAALECGESLTSMYVRINDHVFSHEIEALICRADIMEDPLIRCLFTGVFGSYQSAQLRRLKALNLEEQLE